MKKLLLLLLLFPILVNAQTVTRVIRDTLENKDTLITTITTTTNTVSYLTSSVKVDSVRKKYIPPPQPNIKPIAKAGVDITIQLPVNSTTLSGSGTDADGTISGYSWSRISGPTTFTFGNQFAASTTLSNLVAGTYTFRLTVSDNKGATGTDDVIVIVKAATTSTGQSLIKIDGWNGYVHLPANYTSTTSTYPTIIFFPGAGEVGTNAASVIANGPGAYITQGWNGNVVVDGATVEFIVISLQPPAAYPVELAINAKIAAIKAAYRVDPTRLYLTGLSHGGWCSSTFVTGDPLSGPYTYASQVAAVVEVQGVTPNDNTPYPDLFDNFVKSGGKFLGFEQRLDNRGVPTRVNRMNATVPGSAIYMQTNFGSGGHCCWNNFYGGGGLQPGNFLLGGVTQNLYQWMARQSLKVTVPPLPSACNTNPPVSHIVGPTKPGEIYITNAMSRGWKGGDTLKIIAGVYESIEIDSFGGDQCRDIIIINSGGLVEVKSSIRLQNDVHHVRITGTGVKGIAYGFKCKSFGFNRANHFIMDHIEAGPNPGGVGIYGKQDPDKDKPWTQYPNYVSNKITIDNCYVHDVAGEGMYIGNTAPDGDPYHDGLIPQRMDSVTISNNMVSDCGWDGIQLSNARNGGLIYGNKVTNFGLIDMDGQRAGIIMGGNTQGSVYNNDISNGMGNGIQFFGYGKNECYWNTITNVGNTVKHVNGEESIFGRAPNPLNKVEINPPQEMLINDNQINYPKKWGAIRFDPNNNSKQATLKENKFCIDNAPTNWPNLYIFVAVPYVSINNNLFCKN